MTHPDKSWRFIHNAQHIAAKFRRAGFKVIPYDEQTSNGPAYEVWATQEEFDRIAFNGVKS